MIFISIFIFISFLVAANFDQKCSCKFFPKTCLSFACTSTAYVFYVALSGRLWLSILKIQFQWISIKDILFRQFLLHQDIVEGISAQLNAFSFQTDKSSLNSVVVNWYRKFTDKLNFPILSRDLSGATILQLAKVLATLDIHCHCHLPIADEYRDCMAGHLSSFGRERGGGGGLQIGKWGIGGVCEGAGGDRKWEVSSQGVHGISEQF